jgi:hypothetical protein
LVDEYSPDDLMTQRPEGPVTFKVRPQKPGPRADTGSGGGPLSREELTRLVGKYNPDITPAAIRGEVDNIWRESRGDYRNNTGDGGTSGGLYQHHNERLYGLKKFAAEQGSDWRNPEIQIRYSRLEKERDLPALLKFQQTTNDPVAAEDKFKRVFERPASVLWSHDASGKPVLGNDQYRFSDRAMMEHHGKDGTDLVMMSPADYLDLSPELKGKPFDSASGRALLKSHKRGDAIESVPTLDVASDGGVGTVTDQDGRQRAMLAQENGLDQIPVAVRRTGDAPKELVGMRGDVVPNKFSPVADFLSSAAKRVGQAIIPSAEAKEPISPNATDDGMPAGFAPIGPATGAGGAGTDDGMPAGFAPIGPPRKPKQSFAGPAGDAIMAGLKAAPGAGLAGLKGAAMGLADTAYGAEELVGKGLQAVGADSLGTGLLEGSRAERAAMQASDAPDKAAHPLAYGAGELVGGSAAPIAAAIATGGVGPAAGVIGGLARTVGANALAGGVAGLLQPVGPEGDDNFLQEKAAQTGVGAGLGAAGGVVGNALGKLAGGAFRKHLKTLLDEKVELTPGQMAGGIVKHFEDLGMSSPGLGDAIQAGRKRGYLTFNKAAWNRTLEPIGEKMPDNVPMGRDAADYVADRLSDAYGRIVPNLRLRNIMSDPVWVNDMSAAIRNARATLPDKEFANFERITRAQIEQKLGPGGGGSADGELINGIDSMLGKDVRGYKGSQEHDTRKLGDALEDVQVAFRNLLERQNPAYAQDLANARRGYANYVRVAKAAASTGTATHAGVFSPAQLNTAVRAEDNTTRKLGYSRGKALLQDLSDAGQSVLPSTYPESGTAKRSIVNIIGGSALAGGGTSGHPVATMNVMAALAALSVPYVRPVSQAVNSIMNKLAQPAGAGRAITADAMRLLGMGMGQAGGNALAGRAAPQQPAPAILPQP